MATDTGGEGEGNLTRRIGPADAASGRSSAARLGESRCHSRLRLEDDWIRSTICSPTGFHGRAERTAQRIARGDSHARPLFRRWSRCWFGIWWWRREWRWEWRLSRGAPLTPSPLLAGDTLFVVSDNGIASAIEARSGAVRWQQRLGGTFSASPVLADGRVYFLDEDGRTTVLRADGSGDRLAVNVLDGPALASMAVVPHAFFIRTATHLYRIGD